MIKLDDKYIFTFDKLTKSWRKGRPMLSVQLLTYLQNPKLCGTGSTVHRDMF